MEWVDPAHGCVRYGGEDVRAASAKSDDGDLQSLELAGDRADTRQARRCVLVTEDRVFFGRLDRGVRPSCCVRVDVPGVLREDVRVRRQLLVIVRIAPGGLVREAVSRDEILRDHATVAVSNNALQTLAR